jgi:hypothetical protein
MVGPGAAGSVDTFLASVTAIFFWQEHLRITCIHANIIVKTVIIAVTTFATAKNIIMSLQVKNYRECFVNPCQTQFMLRRK